MRTLLALASAALARAGVPSAARGLLLDAAAAGNAIVAVGERGAIVRSIDSGRNWEEITSSTHATLTGIAFADTQVGWAVGHEGVILHTRDGGQSWSVQPIPGEHDVSFLDVNVLDVSRAFAIGAFGAFFATSDGGRTWTQRKIIGEDLHLNHVTPGPENTLFVAGERGTLLVLTDLGRTPTPLVSPYDGSFYGVLPLGGRVLLAYGLRGHIYRSVDNGGHWDLVHESGGLLCAGVRASNGAVVIAGQARNFFVSFDHGLTFSPWTPPLATAVAELLDAPDGSLLAFGEAGATRLKPPEKP